jgi:hypothetical protein
VQQSGNELKKISVTARFTLESVRDTMARESGLYFQARILASTPRSFFRCAPRSRALSI